MEISGSVDTVSYVHYYLYILSIYIYIYTFAEEWCEVTNRFGWTSIIVPLMVQFGKWLNFNHYHLPVPKK